MPFAEDVAQPSSTTRPVEHGPIRAGRSPDGCEIPTRARRLLFESVVFGRRSRTTSTSASRSGRLARMGADASIRSGHGSSKTPSTWRSNNGDRRNLAILLDIHSQAPRRQRSDGGPRCLGYVHHEHGQHVFKVYSRSGVADPASCTGQGTVRGAEPGAAMEFSEAVDLVRAELDRVIDGA